MLKAIQDILIAKGLVDGKWHERETAKAEIVDLFRQYYNGNHRLKLTAEMRQMMQIDDDRLDRYNANYCDLVVHTMADRIHVDGIEVDEANPEGAALGLRAYLETALPNVDVSAVVQTLVTKFGASAEDTGMGQGWTDALMESNQFDALEQAVTIAMLRDGVTYVASVYQEPEQIIRWHHEVAFDGEEGVIAIWDARREHMMAAVKIWAVGDEYHVNIYYPHETERYKYGTYGEGKDVETKLVIRDDPLPTVRNGRIPGVPFIPFQNKVGDVKRSQSELRDVIPLQDSLNRAMVSMVINAELTAFSILLAVGIMVDAGFTPGMVLQVIAKDDNDKQLVPEDADTAKALADYYNSIRAERIEGSQLSGFIEHADWFINQISVVSSTPIPTNMGGDNQSGEALKQREVGLLGKVRRAQVHLKNGWSMLFKLSHYQETVFAADNPPAIVKFNPRFKDAQIRNDADIQASAEWYISNGFVRQGLRVMSQSSLASHTERDIDKLLAERSMDAQRNSMDAAQGVPGMEQFSLPQLPELAL